MPKFSALEGARLGAAIRRLNAEDGLSLFHGDNVDLFLDNMNTYTSLMERHHLKFGEDGRVTIDDSGYHASIDDAAQLIQKFTLNKDQLVDMIRIANDNFERGQSRKDTPPIYPQDTKRTLFHCLAYRPNPTALNCQLFIDANLRTDLQDGNFDTPLDLAIRNSASSMVHALNKNNAPRIQTSFQECKRQIQAHEAKVVVENISAFLEKHLQNYQKVSKLESNTIKKYLEIMNSDSTPQEKLKQISEAAQAAMNKRESSGRLTRFFKYSGDRKQITNLHSILVNANDKSNVMIGALKELGGQLNQAIANKSARKSEMVDTLDAINPGIGFRKGSKS